ncbi:RNA-binding domain-containing protein [Aspergillus heteromorphus CBS 117.55]|uniref:RNA-binding domain-containing protein n=1 Tax=Aspergillus heteromorphus CBS 117.55 TaxID=1448321 RepID=A0A317UYH5_9EURO|nr:RNA-binding domain-containing protein [Aspergillus heteromorphus CBS 117.55]PWY66409.1 RNA-binding domain-containing protein [Aspergillus heteromorphus CBS 117.55]
MSERPFRGRSRIRSPLLEIEPSTLLRRSVSPRSGSRLNSTSRSRSFERDSTRHSACHSRSQSHTESRPQVPSRSRSRSETSGRYRKRENSRTPSPSTNHPRSSKVIIEKLTKNVNESHLREVFGGFGDIKSLDIPMNKAFMTNRGCAYILYHDPADAEAAIAHMHEAQFDGAILNVSIVLPRRAFSRSPPPSQNGRGSFSRQDHGRGPPSDGFTSRASPFPHRSTTSIGRFRRSRHIEKPDIYRPLSLSHSRSPRPSRSLSSKSLSISPPRRKAQSRTNSFHHRRRRSPSYSSYGYSSRSGRSRSLSPGRDRHRHESR